jgi:hypothetical protein
MTAAILPLQTIQAVNSRLNRPSGMPLVRSELDSAHLTLEAYRVFAHLATHARPTLINNAMVWACCRSLNTIASSCFRGSYPNTTEEVLRRKAGAAMDELIDRHMIEKIAHQPGVSLANVYLLVPMEQWRSPSSKLENRNIRKGRGRRKPPTDPPRITPDHSVNLASFVTVNTNQDAPNTLPRSSQDQDLYSVDIGLDQGFKEREREGENEFSTESKTALTQREAVPLEPDPPPEPERALRDTRKGSPQAKTSFLDNSDFNEQDDRSAASAPKFDENAYEWSKYQRAGDGGSHPGFLKYMLQRTQDYSDRRAASDRKPVYSILEYALAKIHNGGAELYRDFEIAQGFREAPPKHQRATKTAVQKRAAPGQQQPNNNQWQRISDRLNQIPSDALLRALEEEKNHLYGDETARDAIDRVQWLLSQNPQWRIILQDGNFVRLDSAGADLGDLICQIKLRFESMRLDRQGRSGWLIEHGFPGLQAMSEAELKKCLEALQ